MICSLSGINNHAHSGFDLHKADFYAVIGFEDNSKVTAWMRQISSKMIDGYKGSCRKKWTSLLGGKTQR